MICGLCTAASLSPTVLSELTKVVQFLTRSDVFKPQIEEQLNRKPLADDETEVGAISSCLFSHVEVMYVICTATTVLE